jgi:hypothetical protein
MDFASVGLLVALATIFYGNWSGDIKFSFWLAPMLIALVFIACWLLVRPAKYAVGDILGYFATVIIIVLIAVYGRLNYTYSAYFFGYIALAGFACFFTYFGFKELRHIRKPTRKSIEKLRRPMILFIIISVLVCYLYYNNVIWNWGSEEGEISIEAFKTMLSGVSPYSKVYLMDTGWAAGTSTPYSYFPSTLLYYGVMSVLPVSPIFVTPDFSNLKAGTMIIVVLAAVLLFKTFKDLGHESAGRFLMLLYLFVFGFLWGGQDYIHAFAGFFIIFTMYFLARGKNKAALLTAGFAALTQPLGTLVSIFVIVHVFRKTKPRVQNWKNLALLAPAAGVLLFFILWDVQSFVFSIFGWWSSTQGGVASTFFGATSVANFTYFVSPVVDALGARTFFIAKIALMLVFGFVLSWKFTKTVTRTVFSSAVFILTWLLFVNNGVSVNYFQEALVTVFLLLGLLMVKNQMSAQAAAEPAQQSPPTINMQEAVN